MREGIRFIRANGTPSKKLLKKVPLYIEYFSRAKEDKKRMNGRKSRSFGRYV